MTTSGGSIQRREPKDDDIPVQISPGDVYDIPIPRPPFTYWLKPKHWPGEASCWLAQHDWTKYCFVHDVIHWRWTHRNCCNDQRRHALAALRKAGFLR